MKVRARVSLQRIQIKTENIDRYRDKRNTQERMHVECRKEQNQDTRRQRRKNRKCVKKRIEHKNARKAIKEHTNNYAFCPSEELCHTTINLQLDWHVNP